MMLKTRTVQTKLAVGFALGPVILAIIGWIAYTNTEKLVDRDNWRRHTYQVLQQIEAVVARVIDAETGQRGYIITGNDRYLDPYRAAVTNTGTSIKELATLTLDNPRQQARLQTLNSLVRQKFDELADTVNLRRDKGFEAALAVVQS